MLESINEIAWIGANVLVAYIAALITIFVVAYYWLFDPRATTGGRMIFRFMLSLVGVIALIFIGTFIDPSHNREWFNYPGDVVFWRPILRFVIYAHVAYSITSLAVLLVIRKWFPHRVVKAEDLKLVKPRNNTHEIPVIFTRKR